MIESKDCRQCAKEIDNTAKKALKDIVNHRDKCKKCIGCHRLQQVRTALSSCEEMGKD